MKKLIVAVAATALMCGAAMAQTNRPSTPEKGGTAGEKPAPNAMKGETGKMGTTSGTGMSGGNMNNGMAKDTMSKDGMKKGSQPGGTN